jgi:HK97 family phage major capsid protein
MTYTYNPAPFSPRTHFAEFHDHVRGEFEARSLDDLIAHRADVVSRLEQLQGYPVLSQPQETELEDATGTTVVLDELISEKATVRRSEQIARGMAAMADPANREGPDSGSPPLVKGLGDRVEQPEETLQRMRSNPWRHEDGPVNRADTMAGLVSRAHTALEGLEPALTHDGAEKLAALLAESSGWPGMTVKRSRDEAAQAAELVLALSDPHYLSAFRSVLRYPMEFTAGGTGFETMSAEERYAWRRVRTNESVRASFAESSGATGAFALPLQLDDTIILTNAGAAGPHRRLGRTVVGTSNTWNGVTSAGVTAVWAAEGAAVADATPAIGQLVITPYKEAAWITGSLEIIGDTTLDAQVPALISDARNRLEITAFTTGTGSGQPFGVVTRAASDATTGALAASHIYALLGALGPRFRVYDGARPVFMANIANINVARQIPAFTGANFSIVNDNGDTPRLLGLPFEEASAMSAVNTAGAKNLLIGDLSQYVIVDRLPTVMIFEPIVFNATPVPTGQQGWFFYARVGADITTAGAAFGANAFNLHTV